MAIRRIREYLDGNHAEYSVIPHHAAFTASQVAESAHVPGKQMAKFVVVVIGGELTLAVVPASRDIDMRRLERKTGHHDVRLADEAEFARRFEGCKLGTVPPFGNLFGMKTYLDRELMQSPTIAFNAGTHTDVIVMDLNEYCRLARPQVVDISMNVVPEPYHILQL